MEKDFLKISESESDFEKKIELVTENMEELNISKVNRIKIKEYKDYYDENMGSTDSDFIKTKKCLEIISKLDWKRTLKEEKINISKMREFLNKKHYGMEKVKETILESLALRYYMRKSGEKIPMIICLAGSAGIGKTSIAEAVSEGLGREFEKISMSSVTTVFELTGLTKGYTSAAPGRIIKTLAKFESDNPVILLDEIDKINKKNYDGDIEGVLLEILDPDQNKRFRDEYLEIEYDLSNIIFLATANDLSKISEPLKSRMEIIHLESYSLEQKVEIAKKYIIPSINKKIASKLVFEDDILRYIIENYTNEDGVRKLKTILMKIYGKIAKDALEKKEIPQISLENIDSFICADKIPDVSLKINADEESVGEVMGMAVTSFGGRAMPIQTVIVPGNGKIKITGNLSDIMKEGIDVAITYIRSKSKEFNLKNPDFFEKNDIHIHFSENSIPKDGPSAGIAIVTSILSALNEKEMKHNMAFTGEITILGKVLPVGGVARKIEGAYKSGIKRFFIPKENESSINLINKTILNDIEIELVENYEQIYSKIFA
ncbi:endopeptidase [Leptotrichia wadei]|uniref:endopeptidase La n=1 Tax=Leptotrichia wadei TaxID=157687 RepID=A0A510KTT8_9FUSO|nr:S16 family serine protease [Leptotrichia wadei]BBM54657.1 endopeptidase [Leptotrichia wadei]